MAVSTTLAGNISATAGALGLADASGLTSFPTTLHIDAAGDAELVLARAISRNGDVQVERGVFGSTRQAHSAGVTVTTYEPGGGGGDEGGGVTVAAADPGAIGAGSIWLEDVFEDGSYGRLWVRNDDDDAWIPASPLTYQDDDVTLIGSPSDNAELQLSNSTGSYLVGSGDLKVHAGGKALFFAATGVHLGVDATFPVLLTGSAAPSAGGGVAAPIGSVYLRTTGGTLWSKTDAGDTAWSVLSTQPFTTTSLAAYTAAASIALDGASVAISATSGNISIAAAGQAVEVTSAIVRLIGLPTSDPVVAGQLWNSTGTVKISAG